MDIMEERISSFRNTLSDDRREKFPEHIEIALELDEKEWKYYMVDLDNCMIFWIDDCVLDESVLPSHFGVEIREHFSELFFFFGNMTIDKRIM